MKSFRFNVFGHLVLVTEEKSGWQAYYPGEGTRRPATDIKIPSNLPETEIKQWLGDICHEWATARHSKVEQLD
jgi:hypothetical protein